MFCGTIFLFIDRNSFQNSDEFENRWSGNAGTSTNARLPWKRQSWSAGGSPCPALCDPNDKQSLWELSVMYHVVTHRRFIARSFRRAGLIFVVCYSGGHARILCTRRTLRSTLRGDRTIKISKGERVFDGVSFTFATNDLLRRSPGVSR